MKNSGKHIRLLVNSILGEFVKMYYALFPIESQRARVENRPKGGRVIVSLTSYGRRVAKTLPYTVYSLLRQSMAPDMIVIWLDEDHWRDDTLPPRLARLKKKGLVEVRYCEDIRSYKKLIPSLACFPDDMLVTVDDDLFYNRDMIKKLLDAGRTFPDSIIACRAHGIGFSGDTLSSYSEWEKEVPPSYSGPVFPTSGGGTLYRKRLLCKDVTDKELFTRLCPNADDVWWFFMALMHGTGLILVSVDGALFLPLDFFFQHFHKGASLYSTNEHENQNDTQIKAVMEHYGLEVKNRKFVKKDD